MTVLDEIGQEKQKISERLTRLDAERTNLSEQLNELEIAERALNRFGANAVAGEKERRRRPTATAAAANKKGRARGRQTGSKLSLSNASLKAVHAHRDGASSKEVLNYLTRKLRMTV